MILHTSTYSTVQFTEAELGMSVTEAQKLPWVRAGVTTLRPTRLGMEMVVGPYAGRLVFHDDLVVDVAELVPGTVAACLALSRSGRRIAAQETSRGNAEIRADAAIAAGFAHTCWEVLRSGAAKEYLARTTATSRPRGKVLLADTVRGPWGRGAVNRLVCRWQELSVDTPLNRLLLAASVRAEKVLSDSGSVEDKTAARSCLAVLSGVPLVRAPGLIEAAIERLAPSVRELARLAEQIISGIPYAPLGDGRSRPLSAWVNVDRVFEEAILFLCQDILGVASAHHGREENIPLFHSRPSEPPARVKQLNPDVVIRFNGKVLVLDAKYRKSGESPAESELYQLLVHAAAVGADSAALVTPALHGLPGVQSLGRDVRGCLIEVIAVPSADPVSTRRLLTHWLHDRCSDSRRA